MPNPPPKSITVAKNINTTAISTILYFNIWLSAMNIFFLQSSEKKYQSRIKYSSDNYFAY